MRTLFIGGTRRGYLALQALIESGADVVGVLSLTQDDHERERFEEPIRVLAQGRGLPVRETKLMRDPGLDGWARELQAETAFAVGVRVLLPGSFYSIFPRGCWAVHDSLLPEYRGFAPLNWAIINDERETGATLFKISERMDGGDILLRQPIPIGANETAPQLYKKICAATVELVRRGYELLRRGEGTPQPQNHAAGSFTASRTPADGLIDWNQSTRRIFNLVRALTFPYPGAFTFYQNRRLFILSAEELTPSPKWVGRIPGRVINLVPNAGVDVLTSDGVLRLCEVSTDGLTRQCAAAVIKSVRVKLGLDLIELNDRLFQLEHQMKQTGVPTHE
ncbi:MAG: methionyl-tRNA formyltransferase [Verrucomicrobiota bacterium]|jgi:methionyl-tRNA formyltransferase